MRLRLRPRLVVCSQELHASRRATNRASDRPIHGLSPASSRHCACLAAAALRVCACVDGDHLARACVGRCSGASWVCGACRTVGNESKETKSPLPPLLLLLSFRRRISVLLVIASSKLTKRARVCVWAIPFLFSSNRCGRSESVAIASPVWVVVSGLFLLKSPLVRRVRAQHLGGLGACGDNRLTVGSLHSTQMQS